VEQRLQSRRTFAVGVGVQRGDHVASAVIEVCGDEAGGERQGRGRERTIEHAWRMIGVVGVTVVGAALLTCAFVTAWWLPVAPRVPATGATLVVLIGAALVDVVEHRLPNALVALAAVPVLVAVALAWTPDVTSGALAGAAVMGVPLLATHLVSPAGMGFGDVKAGAVVGASLGLVEPQLAALGLVTGLAGAAAWGVLLRRRRIPLGPGLVGGALAALGLGRLLEVAAG
jgi:leader peptidase (prepilin peptidase) / N-methyltransferase